MATISKQFKARFGKEMWGFDGRFNFGGRSRRLAYYEWETKKGAIEAYEALRKKEQEEKFGIAPATERPRLKDLIEQRLETIAKRSEKTRSKRVLMSWLKLIGEDVRVDEITSPKIRAYIVHREEQGQSAASIDRELNIIAATLNAAGEFFPELLQWVKPKVPRPKVSNSRRERIITDSEYRLIVARLQRPADEQDGSRPQNRQDAYKARLRVAAIFQFAMNTGMRPKEIYNLRWRDVDRDGKRIRVYSSKTDTVRYVPLTKIAVEILESQAVNSAKRQFIFTKGGNPTPKMFRIFREASEAAGILYGKKTPGGLVLYCARHTFTTRLLQSGQDIRTVGAITGHTDREMVLHYSHVTPETTAKAAEAIDRIESARRISD